MSTYFTQEGVRKLKPPATGQVDHFEKLNRGLTLMLRVSYGGTKAWRVITYSKGRARARTIGHFPSMSVAQAKRAANSYDPKKAEAAAEAGT
ncbi:MAG: Arm DNA-binding domain-containing protein, partial [Rhodoplanes sp.]